MHAFDLASKEVSGSVLFDQPAAHGQLPAVERLPRGPQERDLVPGISDPHSGGAGEAQGDLLFQIVATRGALDTSTTA